MGVDAQVANAAPPQATATPRKASWPLIETGEVTEEVPEPTSSCGREGSSSPRTLAGGSPPGAKAGGSAAGEDSVCDATFGDLRALSDQILRNAEGVLEDIPLSQWEQLVGFFDESWPQRGDTPTTASLDKLSLGDDDVAWPGLKVAADEVTPLPFDFAAGQLDPESLFDPEMVTESWINVSADPPALPDIAMFEARAHERTRAALLGLSAAPTRVASMRTMLESLLLLHDRELDGLAERRAVDADVQLAAAYVSLEHQQGWEYALKESHASVLKSRGLTDALTDPDATPYNRAIVLRIEELRRSFAAALRGFDAQLQAQAARLASLRAEPGSAADIARIAASLPSALTGIGLDRAGITQRAWEIETSGAFEAKVLPGAALKDMLAAPEQASSAAARKVLTGPLDARLASRAAAMHRMALRAFATAAAEAAAPEKHPETAAALLPASSKPTALQLRGSAPELRCGGRPTPASRSTLKAWMQDHFFPSASHPHGPFPTAAEKEALADQTGLSVNQISDWFVNARARWWKPMVEGMHRGLCDADDEPAAALPAVPEGGSGDDAMDEAEARAMAPRKARRRAGSGIARAPAPLQHDFPAGGRNGSRGGSECGSDFGFDGLVSELGIVGGL